MKNSAEKERRSLTDRIKSAAEKILFLWSAGIAVAYLVYAALKTATGGTGWKNATLLVFALLNILNLIVLYLLPLERKRRKKVYKTTKKTLKIARNVAKAVMLASTLFAAIFHFDYTKDNLFMIVLTFGYFFFVLFRLSLALIQFIIRRKVKIELSKVLGQQSAQEEADKNAAAIESAPPRPRLFGKKDGTAETPSEDRPPEAPARVSLRTKLSRVLRKEEPAADKSAPTDLPTDMPTGAYDSSLTAKLARLLRKKEAPAADTDDLPAVDNADNGSDNPGTEKGKCLPRLFKRKSCGDDPADPPADP